MKNSGIKSIVTVLLLTVVTTLTVVLNHQVNASDCCNQPDIRVKAQWVNGILMPVVDLPEVEITASRKEGRLVKGKIHNGELLIESELPEVEIIGLNPKNHGKPGNSDLMADPNLPMVEVQSTIPQEKMISGRIDVDGQPLATATLPVVEISAEAHESSEGFMAMESNAVELQDSSEAKAGISTFVSRFHLIEWIRLLFQRVSIGLLRSTR